jgi:hypothetical protein
MARYVADAAVMTSTCSRPLNRLPRAHFGDAACISAISRPRRRVDFASPTATTTAIWFAANLTLSRALLC